MTERLPEIADTLAADGLLPHAKVYAHNGEPVVNALLGVEAPDWPAALFLQGLSYWDMGIRSGSVLRRGRVHRSIS